MRTLAIANHKGGVGKTSITHALGVVLAGEGLRVLLVDVDPQASLTQSAGVSDAAGRSLAEVLGGAQPGRLAMADILVPVVTNLTLAPADISLAAVELQLVSRLGRENVLKKALQPIAGRFDLCLIDCPPSLGLLTLSALVAADTVAIPTAPQVVDLRGLRLFIDSIEAIKSELNPDLETLGVVVNFYDPRLIHHREAIEAMQQAGLMIIPATIGRSIKVAEAAGAGQSVITFQPSNPRAGEYKQLSEVVITWLKNRQA